MSNQTTKRIIAYRRADHCQSMIKGSVPDEFITEHTYVDLHPEGSLKEENGWLFIEEDKFWPLLKESNDEEKHKEWRKQKYEQHIIEHLKNLEKEKQ